MKFGSKVFLLWVCYSDHRPSYAKAAGFEWCSDQAKALSLIQKAPVRATLPPDPRDPADPVVFDPSMEDKEGVWNLCRIPPGE